MRKKFTIVIAAASMLMLMSFTYIWGYASGSESAPVPYQTLDIRTAKAYHQSYYAETPPTMGVIRAFSINIDQYNAMGRLLMENPGVTGFRIYFGRNNSGESTMMVLGLKNGTDLIDNIYATSGSASGLCPVICDENSQMIHD